MAKLLIKNTAIYQDQQVLEGKSILIENDNIKGIVNADSEEEREFAAEEVIQANGMLASPGLVNTHTHIAMTLFRSYADDMKLMDWLEKKIWPIEAKLDREEVYWATQLGIAEMLRGGTTAFADMYFFMEETAKAVKESGIRAALSRGLAGVSPNGEQALAENVQFFRDWHNQADGRITVQLGPHAPYTCPVPYLHKVAEKAKEIGAQIHMHLSETREEVANCQKEHGKTPIALMNEIGIFDTGCIAAHCVHVTEEDMDIMAEKKVRVAHNPQSNLKLASGIAPVPAMLKKGIVIGLGTDGASSNNNLDMIEEMRLAVTLHKANTYDPLAVPAAAAIDMASTEGAKVLGYTNIGEIKPGFKADITLWNREGLHWQPRHDMVSLMAYSAAASDADTVIVNGKVLMKNRELLTIDEERVKAEIEQCKEKLFQ